MSQTKDMVVPDLGDVGEVDVVEVLVAVGDTVAEGDSLIALESDKASMEVPSTANGVIKELSIEAGGTVVSGQVIGVMEVSGDEAPAKPAKAEAPKKEAPKPAPPPAPEPEAAPAGGYDCQLVVIGSGPGGYSAAFRGADLGLDTVLIERYANLGGVCLNVGCIPSKALLHSAKIIDEVAFFKDKGLDFGELKIDLDKLRGWKDQVVGRLTGGIASMAKSRKVNVVQGTATFTGAHSLEVDGPEGKRTITFEKAIIAAGSQAFKIPGIPFEDPRVMDSTDALDLEEIPGRLLVVGGGIIGLEMATVYDALGAKVTVVELMDRLIPGCDKDLVRPLEKRIKKHYENIYLKTMVKKVEAKKDGLHVTFEGGKAPETDIFDRVLVAVGRRPNGFKIGAEQAGVHVNERGFIPVDDQMRTNVAHIFAIGDIAGEPMLAHKATHEAHVAAEVAAGQKSGFDATVIPSVAYTDPEVAWVGLTEEKAKADGIPYEKGVFPWAASGRSLAIGNDQGLTKMLFDPETHRVLGAGAVGPNAGELIAEAGLAIEMGADAEDVGLTIHAHPTLSESMGMAAEAFKGTITDLYIPKKKK